MKWNVRAVDGGDGVVAPWRGGRRPGACRLVDVQHDSPLPGRHGIWKGSLTVSELTIFDALDRDHPGSAWRPPWRPGSSRARRARHGSRRGGSRAHARCGCCTARGIAPRRARCAACETTHVLSPSWLVPRRRDGAEVIGEALRLAALGVGHRVIARRLGRPPGTVRGWLRAGRRRAQSLRACAIRRTCSLDLELGAVTPAGSELGDAVEAIMLAVRAWVPALRPRRHRRVGASGLPDRRAALGPTGAPAVAGRSPGRARRHDLIAIQLRTVATGQAPQQRSTSSRAPFGA